MSSNKHYVVNNGLYVKVKNDNVDKALKKLKKKVKKSNIMVDYFNSMVYTKPSVLKRMQKQKVLLRRKYNIVED